MAGIPELAVMKYPGIMQYQGVLVRFVALVIDSIILAVTFGILGSFFGTFSNVTSTSQGIPLYYGAASNLLAFIIYIAYFTALEGSRGQTVGKSVMRIKVVKEDGGRIDMGSALIRNVLRIVDALFIYLIGAMIIWRTSKKQRIGDFAAKTVVIKV